MNNLIDISVDSLNPTDTSKMEDPTIGPALISEESVTEDRMSEKESRSGKLMYKISHKNVQCEPPIVV